MKEVKLTEAQINQLYSFTRKHFVEWYDLQTELVDHLANGIETVWEENPKLSFEQILNSEFRKFGIFGFSDVVEKRQNALRTKYNMLVAKLFKNFFRLPTIIITLSVLFVIFYMLKYVPYPRSVFLILFAVITIAAYVKIIIENRKKKKQRKDTDKRWLFEEIIHGYESFTVFMIFPIELLLNFSHLDTAFLRNPLLLFITCFLLISYALIAYIILFFIPSKAEMYLNETYPEYRFSKV